MLSKDFYKRLRTYSFLIFMIIMGLYLLLFQTNQQKEKNFKYHVLTTFSILEDITKNIIGDDLNDVIHLKCLVPLMVDPHTYQLKPSDVIHIKKTDLFIMNGVGFEGWLDCIVKDTDYKKIYIKVGEHLPLRKDGEKNVYDPHLWHNVHFAISYVEAISNQLCLMAPECSSTFKKNAAAYRQELKILDQWIFDLLSTLTQDQQTVITTHDAFWYFSKRYGLSFLSPIGLTTEEEPSPKKVCYLIDFIKKHPTKAIFIENLSNQKQINKIVEETNAKIGGMLYADSLSGKNGPASTYIDMMRYNVTTIYNALKA